MDKYDRITKLLKEKHITRKQMCLDTGISYESLTVAFKRKTKTLSTDKMKQIADYLDTSLDYLVNGEQKETKESTGSFLVSFSNNKVIRNFNVLEEEYNALILIVEDLEKGNKNK